MGKLVSIVMTCLVVLSNRLQFWKNWQKRQGHDGPSQGLVSKHLENLKLDTENRLSELRNGMAGRTVTDYSVEIESLTLATTCRTDRRRHDGPSQVAQSQSGSDFFIRFKGRFLLFLL